MPGVKKPTPIEAFDSTMEDARHLAKLVDGFTNRRVHRMRTELRGRIGDALRLSAKHQAELDCLQSADVFLIFMPGSSLTRDDFVDARPLLRQAVVAACAAFETYLGDKVMSNIGPLLRSTETLTPRLRRVPLTLGDFIDIEEQYERTRFGIRHLIVEPYVREAASTASSKVGELLSAIGIDNWAKKVDGQRNVAQGDTVKFLDSLTVRRNKIAHEGDRLGRSRADLSVAQVRDYLEGLNSIVQALEVLID